MYPCVWNYEFTNLLIDRWPLSRLLSHRLCLVPDRFYESPIFHRSVKPPSTISQVPIIKERKRLQVLYMLVWLCFIKKDDQHRSKYLVLETGMIKILDFFIAFWGCICQQTVGIPMGTNRLLLPTWSSFILRLNSYRNVWGRNIRS